MNNSTAIFFMIQNLLEVTFNLRPDYTDRLINGLSWGNDFRRMQPENFPVDDFVDDRPLPNGPYLGFKKSVFDSDFRINKSSDVNAVQNCSRPIAYVFHVAHLYIASFAECNYGSTRHTLPRRAVDKKLRLAVPSPVWVRGNGCPFPDRLKRIVCNTSRGPQHEKIAHKGHQFVR